MSAKASPAPLTPDHILQVGFSFWACKVLLSAIELELFTELAKHPLPQGELEGRLGLHPRSARDFFDALVATGFLERDGEIYRNTPATDLFLDKRKATYMGGILEMCNRRLYPFWSHLTEALRTGRPQNEARNGSMSLFEALYAEPARLKEFLRAMTGLSRGANETIARQFPWKTYRTFADIGKSAIGFPGELAGYGFVCAPAEAGHGSQEFLQSRRFGVEGFEQRHRTVASFVLRASGSQRLGEVRPERVQTTVTHLEDAAHIGRLPFVQKQIRCRCVPVDLTIAL